MKESLVFIAVLGASSVFAQSEIVGAVNEVNTGINYNFSYKYTVSSHSFLAGFKYHQGIRNRNEGSIYAYKDKFYPTSLAQCFGLTAGYNYNFKLNHSKIEPFVFYDFQFFKAPLRYSWYNEQYEYHVFYTNPVIALENYTGLGFNAQLYKNIYLNMRAGVGVALYREEGRSVFGNPHAEFFSWEAAAILSGGLSYRFPLKSSS